MSKALLPVLLLACGALIVLLQFGFIFLLLALSPSIVACYVDHQPGKNAFKIVFACNLAATAPSLAPMLSASMKFRHFDASATLDNWDNWLLVLSGAAAGWCLIYLCRTIARVITMLFYEYNIATLEGQQTRLVEEWGQQITHPPGTGRG